MIDRIVLIKLNDSYANDEGRAEVIETSRDVLASLPGVLALTLGVPADERSRASWDIRITLRFDDLDAIEAYLPHPKHRAFVDEFLRPRMDCIKAWNFKVA